MPDTPNFAEEPTAVDDVRRVRDSLDRASGGDLRKHIAATNASFDKLRNKLNLKLVAAPHASTVPPKTAIG